MNHAKYLLSIAAISCCLLSAGCFQPYEPLVLSDAPRQVYEKPEPFKLPDPAVKPPKPLTLTSTSLKGKVIVVDAGHGGKDPGTGESGYSKVYEKRIVLDIATKLAQKLKSHGAKVIMTRKDDTFVELPVRAAIAQNSRADLMVSIHADSNHRSSRRGTTLYIAPGASYKTRKIAQSILNSIKNAGVDSFGIRNNKNFHVLVKHSRPAVLIECGFLSNRQDAKNLNSTWYRSKIANIIANGIANAF